MKKLFTLSIVLLVLSSFWQVNLVRGSDENPPPTEETPGSVTAHKFNAADGSDIADWGFRLYFLDGVGIQLFAEGVTGSDGVVTFADVPPGLYKVWEELPECWEPTTPGSHWDGGYYIVINLAAGQQTAVEFGNRYTCTTPPPPPEPSPSIDIEKYVSVDDQATWHDANSPPGPEAVAGSETVWFRFAVTNDGDVALTGTTLSDSVFDAAIASQCTVPGTLGSGESFECVIGPFVAIEGQHINTGTATGNYDGQTYDDTDRAKYFGIPPEPPEPGTIIVEKQTDPDGSTQSFEFSASYGPNFALADGETHNSGPLDPGVYSVSEINIPAGWSLTSATCDDGSDPSAISLDGGETVICTFTNTEEPPEPGTIIVEKQTDPDGSIQSFEFSASYGPNFALADDETHNSGPLDPGVYSVSEINIPAGWSLTSATCDDGSDPSAIDLQAGETVKCVFTNTEEPPEPGTIIVEKQTDPDGALDTFTFTGDAAGTIADGGQIVVSGLQPGVYTSQETVPSGWALTSILCDDANSSGDASTGIATFQLEAGETVKCVFTNTEEPPDPGAIIVEKQTDPDGAPDTFTFTGDAAGTIADGGQIVVSGLQPGVYTSQETVPSGWALTSILCDDANSSGDASTGIATFQLEAGETVKCTFLNTQGSFGCTYTQGYWKTHPEVWPVTMLVLGTVSYDQAELLSILNQSVGGNGLISLAHQLIAAKLNVANGASLPSGVAAAIADADALIGGQVVPPVGSGHLATSVTSGLTFILDDYNNGRYLGGPPHCNDECRDVDQDGVCDYDDNCVNTPNPGQEDADGDGIGDACDGCPNDPDKTEPGACGCGNPDTDSDGDGVADCNDGCPDDPNKTEPGACGCGNPDTDGDGDGVADCNDGCPDDADKIEPGVCGCGTPDDDSDGDGVLDCNDGCPDDPNKTEPGDCGCGVADTDTDADGVADCIDNCPDIYNPDQADSDGDGIGDACEAAETCISLTKTINGPHRTADNLFLTDGIIPVAVQRDIDPPGTPNTENLFYFLVEITVENCGGTELTGVEVEDTFSNEAQPFETDDPGNVTISPAPDPTNGMVHESLTWSIGAIPAGGNRTLQIKVGTEFNPSGRLEPTSFGQSVFYNGRDDSTGSASVTTNEGPSASVGAMEIGVGSDLGTCVGTDGQWNLMDAQSGPNIRPHDKCAAVTTLLPITLTSSDGSALATAPAPSPVQRAAPVAAAGAATTGLAGAAWWLLRRKLLFP